MFVTINSIHHKINRRAMLIAQIEEYYQLIGEEDNWMVIDDYIECIIKLEAALEELLRCPVGGMVDKYPTC